MPFRVLIVDDEPLAREGLRLLLADDADFPDIQEARNGREAVQSIRSGCPDLVFLDVQMPEMDGFGVVREIGPERMPPVVFVTAHDRYAIQAFEINAADYLLKPVTAARFGKTLERIKLRLGGTASEDASRQILSLLQTIAEPRRYAQRLAVRAAGKTAFVDVGDVHWMESAENYVQLHTTGGSPLVHMPMNALEQSLDPDHFLRIHRCAIVNVRQIKELQPASHGEYIITLHNGTRIQSGRMYHAKLKALSANSLR